MTDTVPLPTTPASPWWVLPGLAVAVLSIFAGAIYLATGDTRNNLLIMAGSLATMAMGYFFGSSNGSQKKDDTAAATNANAISALASSTPPSSPDDAAKALEAKLAT